MKRGKGICAAILISLCGATAATVVSASADTTGDQAAPAPDVTVAAATTASAPTPRSSPTRPRPPRRSDPGGTRGPAVAAVAAAAEARAAPTTVPRWAPLHPAAAAAAPAGGGDSGGGSGSPAPRARAAAAATRRAAPTAATGTPSTAGRLDRQRRRPGPGRRRFVRRGFQRLAGPVLRRRARTRQRRERRRLRLVRQRRRQHGRRHERPLQQPTATSVSNPRPGRRRSRPPRRRPRARRRRPPQTSPTPVTGPARSPPRRPAMACQTSTYSTSATPISTARHAATPRARCRRGRHGQPGSARRAPRHGLAARPPGRRIRSQTLLGSAPTAPASTHSGHGTTRGGAPRPVVTQPIAQHTIIQSIEQVVPPEIWLALAAALAFGGLSAGWALYSGPSRPPTGERVRSDEHGRPDRCPHRRAQPPRVPRGGRARARTCPPVRPRVSCSRTSMSVGSRASTTPRATAPATSSSRKRPSLLQDSARADDVVGRLGGDEMGLLLVEQGAEGADAVRRRVAVTGPRPAREARSALRRGI